MASLSGLSRMLMFVGIVLFAIGLALQFTDRIPFLGKLPGDIHIQRGSTTFYFPIVTCVVISVIGSLLLWFISKR